jgi:nitrate reductase gamma subunit
MQPVSPAVFGLHFRAGGAVPVLAALALPRTLYVSNLPDYAALILLGATAATGILLSYWAHVNIVDVKAFTLGLMTLRPVAPPQHPLFLIHLILVLSC